MKSVTATEAKQLMGQLLESAILEPVLVVKGKNKRPVAVVMSFKDYEALKERCSVGKNAKMVP